MRLTLLERLRRGVAVGTLCLPCLVSAQDLIIGMVNAQSGPAADLGRGMSAGAQAVFNEVNARGGVHGRKLVLKVADDAYEPEQTVEQTLKLLDSDQVLALLGFVGTPTTNAVLPLIAELNVPLVGVFSGAQNLRMPPLPHVFNVRASYEDETEALVGQLHAAGVRRLGVIYQNDGFGLSVLSGVQKALKKRGAEVAGTGSFQRNTLAIKMALATMVELQPDALVLVGPYAPVAALVRQTQALGLKVPLATVSFVGTESLSAQLQGQPHDVLISQVVPSPQESTLPIVQGCRQALLKQGGQPLGFVNFEGCISASLLVLALERAGPKVTRQSLLQTLDGMKGVNLGGLSVDLSAQQHQASHRVFLTRLLNGRIQSLDPLSRMPGPHQDAGTPLQ